MATVRTSVLVSESNGFLKSFETGLPEQNWAFTARWPFDNCLRRDAFFWHSVLDDVDVQSPGSEVVYMRAFESDDIGYEPMLIMQALIFFCRDCRFMMPAECLYRLLYKFLSIFGIEATI
ncbi:hypothetical protein D3C75_1025640 [compost metagenome]